MSLGRTGTMWLIQQNLPPLTHTQTHTYGRAERRVNTRRRSYAGLHLMILLKQKRLPSNMYGAAIRAPRSFSALLLY